MDFPDARQLMTQEAESARLKKLLADSMLDASIQKDLLGKKWRRLTREEFYPASQRSLT